MVEQAPVFPVLEGKTAIVTGAAMGMGEATARLFAQAGANVVVADFNEEKGRAVADSINANGGRALFVHTDVSNSQAVQDMVAATVAEFGELNVAINNAAMTPDNAPADDFDEDYWDRLMAVDLKGTALCQKYELKQMRAQNKGGSIVNISSVSGFRPQPNNIAYVAAKHGVVGMTRVAAMENGPYNIRVNTVAPGAIQTPMLDGALQEAGIDPKEFAPQLSLLGRFGESHEIAQASLWLASDAASYITGSIIHADAGYVGR